MKFNGDLCIADPCYIAKSEDWADDNGFDPMGEIIGCEEFSNYLMKSTGIGDGAWNVYELEANREYTFPDIQAIIKEREYSACRVIGEFSVDSSMACVVYQHEADEYNPSFKNDFKDKPSHYAIIENFDGEIDPYFDSDGELHFMGLGNRCFFTA